MFGKCHGNEKAFDEHNDCYYHVHGSAQGWGSVPTPEGEGAVRILQEDPAVPSLLGEFG